MTATERNTNRNFPCPKTMGTKPWEKKSYCFSNSAVTKIQRNTYTKKIISIWPTGSIHLSSLSSEKQLSRTISPVVWAVWTPQCSRGGHVMLVWPIRASSRLPGLQDGHVAQGSQSETVSFNWRALVGTFRKPSHSTGQFVAWVF